MSPAPDAAQREAAHNLEVRRRLREAEEAVLGRAPEHDLQPSLERISAVMELLGDPQRGFPVIHVTGTNGKTSTARIIEAVLAEAGLKVGRFTSPHLHSMLERIAVGGRPVDPERFLAAYEDVLPFVDAVDARSQAAGGPRMTYFEVLVAVAYAAFADLPVDVAVVEVGMGGSWDATNVVEAPVSVLTPIDVDHRSFLGDTPEEIAREKAGIIKTDGIAVLALQPDRDAAEVLLERAAEVGARAVTESVDFGVLAREVAVGGQQLSLRGLAADYPDLFLPLHGAHQAQNAAVAVAAVEAFLGGGEQALDLGLLRAGLARVESPGRLEVVRRSPTVLVDAAHNPAGARALRAALEDSFAFVKLVGVLAVMKDKDAAEMLEALEPVVDEVVVTRNSSPRSMRPAELGEIAADILGEHRVTVVDDLPDALDRAAGLADEGGVGGGVLATGSVVTAAEVRMLLGTTDV
ncbi:bifunctional folylpolyglutamate synthase/dihydrofolate synthase [Phycicoccus endophyticus]|uniref:Dihydrofolate synthase/folylpolyglutamate synthase n=1 Tax=Phycicoccus endophyticus TaxID=1690220 RepID=A0A7G9R3N3_9MICO|nr:folylpolyglutamate synthase/dihydrofolate synthase family protein [Phycicoccus endophyticus]NHI18027.1 bifunctional folylpolyglutamate synthase/dihydrofolate synthase [Phycicoccus endophyticus]QNN50208.1 bifunctional folylpolyglutamate synthase/dihydrofolate synthase [Phycicoccus endophyticus]